jgi:RHS repeat-associated protein
VGLWTNAAGALLDDFNGGTGSGAFAPGAAKVWARVAYKPAAQATPPAGGHTISYYYFGGQRIAMRKRTTSATNGTVYWLHGDHLGSASAATNSSGVRVNEMRFKPFGEVRTGTMSTDLTWTGQRVETSGYVGSLMDFSARFYSPAIGRFISADSIVPNLARPQSLNRFSYVENRPLNLVDSSGHFAVIPFLLFAAVGALLLTSDVSRPGPMSEGDRAASQLGISIIAGDVNDVVTIATGYDYISDEAVPYGSGEWWATAAVAVLPLASGSAVRVGKKLIKGIDSVGQGGKVSRRVNAKIWSDSPLARTLRAEANDIYYQVNPHLRGLGLQIHHRIPLEWAHLFPDADPNRLSNLVGVSRDIHDEIGRRWTAFRTKYHQLGRPPTAAEVQQQAAEIDREFSQHAR